MPSATRKGDISSGHGCFPPSPAIEGSDDVFINGMPAVRAGDAFAAHGCGNCSSHGRNASAGSSTVNINGKPAVRVGDGINCGGSATTGSANVFIGDLSWNGKESLPMKPSLYLKLTNTAGSLGMDRPYSSEPYKLYKDGAMVQQGITDEEGNIEYEYDPPWNSTLKVETMFGEYTFLPEGLQPPETEQGVEQRLGMLGYHDNYHDEIPVQQETGKASQREFLGELEQDEELDDVASLLAGIKGIIP